MSGFESAFVALAQRSSLSGWFLCVLALFMIWQQYIKQRPEMAKLEIDENGAIRTEYIKEMAALRQEITGLREENKSLRDEVRELHGMLDGLRREQLVGALATQSAIARSVVEELPPATKAALDRLDMLPKKGGGE